MEAVMAEQETNVPVKKVSPALRPYSEMFDFHPLESLRRQINSLFPDLAGRKNLSDFEPFERLLFGLAGHSGGRSRRKGRRIRDHRGTSGSRREKRRGEALEWNAHHFRRKEGRAGE
jgi:hypothetical protein